MWTKLLKYFETARFLLYYLKACAIIEEVSSIRIVEVIESQE